MNPWAGNQLSNRLGQITGLDDLKPLTLSGQLQRQFDEIKQRPFQYQAPAYTPPPVDPADQAQDVFGSVARYGMPGDTDLSPGAPLGWLYQLMMQQAYEDKYPSGNWRNAPTMEQATRKRTPQLEGEPWTGYRPTAWTEGEPGMGYRPTAY